MTERWLCDGICGRHFASTKNRIQLDRRLEARPNSCEHIPYLEICTDCESYEKRWRNKRRRNGST